LRNIFYINDTLYIKLYIKLAPPRYYIVFILYYIYILIILNVTKSISVWTKKTLMADELLSIVD